MSTEKKEYNIFSDREDALDTVSCLLKLVEALAKRHGFPFLATYQPNEDYMTTFHHLPENTGSELKAAWYELGGNDDEH